MNKVIPRFIFFISLSIVVSCTPKEMTISELRQYVHDEKNGLTKIYVAANGIHQEVRILRSEQVYADAEKPVKKLDSLRYFLVTYNKDGREVLPQTEGTNNYASLLENLSFNASKYSRLIIDRKDTVQIDNAVFNNSYGTASANTWLLIFKARTPDEEYELDIDELGLNIGDVKTVFKKGDITQFDQITIKNK